MKKFVLPIFYFLFCSWTPISSSENASGLPETCLGYISFQNLSDTLTHIDALLSPIGRSSQTLTGLIFSIFFKNTKMESFDLSQDILYIRLDPKTHPNPFLYSAHLKDKALFLMGFGKGLFGGSGFTRKEATRDQPIEEFTEERTQFDREAYLKALEKDPKTDVMQFQKKVLFQYYVAFRGSLVIVSGDRNILKGFQPEIFLSSQTGQASSEKMDCEMVLNTQQAYEAYHEDLESLKVKLNPILSSDKSKLLSLALESLENNLPQIRHIVTRFHFENNKLDLNTQIEPVTRSKLESQFKNSVPTQNLLETNPPENVLGLMKISFNTPVEIEKVLSMEENAGPPALFRNYLAHIQNLVSLYFFPGEKKAKALVVATLKREDGTKTRLDFNRFFQEADQAQISKREGSSCDQIQWKEKSLYSTFLKESQNQEEQHWIGLQFNSEEDFLKAIEKTKESKVSSDSEFSKRTASFPKSLNFLLYVHPDNEINILAYGRMDQGKLNISASFDVKNWLEKNNEE
ncbi:MAG: hypothetical protein HYS08_09825 [Chlamydiae bacterium]|nr:hypothetical protein [Chlamydiota bacterium]MBI3267359.1 hypothetical protein [Chlamydiota bacterium]